MLGAVAAAPRADTLFVVDSARYKHESSVLAVDASSGAVMQRFPAGHQPDAILSRDGRRLYVTSSAWIDRPPSWTHTLKTYDATSGALLSTVDTPDRLLVTLDRYGSRLTMSPSGRFIYIFNNEQTDHDEFYLAFFDTSQGRLLKARADLFGCGDAVVVPTASDERVNVLCGHAAVMRQFALNASRDAVEDVRVPIRERRIYRSGLVLSNPQTDTLTLIDQDWIPVQVNMRARSVVSRPEAVPALRSGQAQSDRWIRAEHVVTSGPSVFIATGSRNDLKTGKRELNEIEKLNAVTLQVEGVLKLSKPIYSMARSADGRTIYGVSPDDASIVSIDGDTLKEIRRLKIPAESPIFALVSR
jgi:hypothetical protein